MKLTGIKVPGFRIGNSGKVEKTDRRISVSKRIARKKSRKVTVKRRTLGGN